MADSADTFSGSVGVRSQIARRIREGSDSLFNLSVYSLGMSGVWTGVGSVILPFKVIQIVENEAIAIYGWELSKNGLLALISLLGLSTIVIVQPLIGFISDRAQVSGRSMSKRLPFVIFGLFGLAAMTLTMGIAESFLAVLLVSTGMQVLGNTAQGPANALIIDHVSFEERGRASGMLNLMRLAGAGLVTFVVVAFMANYHPDDAPQWMWYSIIAMTGVLVATTVYTILALRLSPAVHRGIDSAPIVEAEKPTQISEPPNPLTGSRVRYILFLVALAFSLAALSAISTNALFFFQDVVGLENPARGGNLVLIALVGSSAIVVYPAGKLSDKVGRGVLLLAAGLIGAAGVLGLIYVRSIFEALIPCVAIGISVGLYLSVGWAVANDLVRRSTAARDLGLTSISSLIGSIVGKTSGFGIGALNRQSEAVGIENLGYVALLIGAAVAFVLSGIMLWRVVK